MNTRNLTCPECGREILPEDVVWCGDPESSNPATDPYLCVECFDRETQEKERAMTTYPHEMRMCSDGQIRAIFTDEEGREFAEIDGKRDYSEGAFPCAWCDGTGTIEDDEHGDCACSRCAGTGQAS